MEKTAPKLQTTQRVRIKETKPNKITTKKLTSHFELQMLSVIDRENKV